MVAMKGAMPHTAPFFVAGVRLVPAGLLAILAAALLGRSQPRGWRAWAWIALFALVDAAMFQGFLAVGLTLTGAGLGSVTIDSQPLAVAVMARWLFGETIGIWGGLGLALGVVGISLVSLPAPFLASLLDGSAWADRLAEASWADLVGNGQWWMLLAALSMAVGTVTIRGVSRHADPVAATGWHMLLGGLPLFALSAWGEAEPWARLTGPDWAALAYTSVFGGAIAYGVFFYLASKGNLTSLSSLTFTTPMFALLFGNAFLGETLTATQAIGVGVTLVAIYLVNRRDALARWRPWRRAAGGDGGVENSEPS